MSAVGRSLLVITALVVLGVAGLALRMWGGDAEPHSGAPLERALDGLDTLARQFPPPGDEALALPRDHGTRGEQFAESWLFAGLLSDADGSSYGFQLAFYRVAVQPQSTERESAWGARDVYRARFALEPSATTVRAAERVSRAALGLAGAEEAPAGAWLEDWSFTTEEATGTFLLRARYGEAALEARLLLPPTTPARIDGELYRGFWWPGLRVDGTLEIDGRSRAVSGQAMLDRLWGRALPAGRGQLALARLWLQLDEGDAIRCEQLRRRAGGGTPLLECLQHPRPLLAAPELEPQEGGWQAVAGSRYPLAWTLRLSADSEALSFKPLSSGHAPFSDGAWSGIVVAPGTGARWGLLELSNFSTP
jgi:predicted secreted hydrolase